MIDAHVATTAAELEGAYRVRARVFIDEQQVPAEIERDEFDDEAIHVVAVDRGRVIGTGRMVIETGQAGPDAGDAPVARIGRMAVDAEYRGRWIGALILARLEDEATARGITRAELHAQLHAEGFYTGAGYIRAGEEFSEAGIDHVLMTKTLSA